MYMKPNNVGANIWLRARTLNEKFKKDAQTQDADGRQAFFHVIHNTFRGHISTSILLIGQAPSPRSATFSLRQKDVLHCYFMFSCTVAMFHSFIHTFKSFLLFAPSDKDGTLYIIQDTGFVLN